MVFSSGKNSVSFISEGVELKGDLYLPEGFDSAQTYPAVVVTGSWTTVKEQMAGLYAAELAKAGYVALAFDFRHYGASGAEPRYFENPPEKIADIQNAVTYLESLPFVAASRIGGVGVCASSGYMAHAAGRDPRIKSLVLIAPWLHDPASVGSYYGGAEGVQMRRDAAAAAKAKYEATGESTFTLSASNTDTSAAMYWEGDFLDYYLNPKRGGIPEWGNRFNVMSWEPWLTYDGIGAAEGVKVPIMIVASETMATPDGAKQFYARLSGVEKDILWTEGLQLDFYDQPRQVTTTTGAATAHLRRTL
jgi:dienelactone hydrolase